MSNRTKAGDRLAAASLALDHLAFAEWWHLVEWRLHARGTAERLWQRAYEAGLAAGIARAEELNPPKTGERDPRGRHAWAGDADTYRPAPTARANERRAS